MAVLHGSAPHFASNSAYELSITPWPAFRSDSLAPRTLTTSAALTRRSVAILRSLPSPRTFRIVRQTLRTGRRLGRNAARCQPLRDDREAEAAQPEHIRCQP